MGLPSCLNRLAAVVADTMKSPSRPDRVTE
jgi:hypothetical protein